MWEKASFRPNSWTCTSLQPVQSAAYDKVSYKHALRHLVGSVGGNRWGKKIGIPMGIDPAPQMAYLYLYHYEAAFMKTWYLCSRHVRQEINFPPTSLWDFTFLDELISRMRDGQWNGNHLMHRYGGVHGTSRPCRSHIRNFSPGRSCWAHEGYS